MLRLGTVLIVGLAILAWGSEAKAQAPTVTCVPVKPIAGPMPTWNFPAGGTYNPRAAMTTSIKVQLKKVPMNGGQPVFGVIQNATWGNGNYTIVINNATYLPLANDYFMEATIWILQNGTPVKGGTSGWIAVPK